MHPETVQPTSTLFHFGFALVVVSLWTLTHGYAGIIGDAQLYAFQALAKLTPTLSSDLYLQNTSQDHFTLFSPMYALFIRTLGIDSASAALTMFFSLWLIAAAWWVAAILTDERLAWLGVAFMIMASADYGASGVFHYSEYFLTARLPAQALIVTALAVHLKGRPILGLIIATAALALHPLMALPGILLLLAIRQPPRVVLGAAFSMLLLTVSVSLVAIKWPHISRLFTVMDFAWLNVVQERSQFLFLQLWTVKDWDTNVRPFLLLAFAIVAFDDVAVARLGFAASVVGAAGLAMAFIGGCIGPVALMVQGQTWRWVWLAFMLSVLLLPAAVIRVSRDPHCGSLCVTFLVAAWLISNVAGTICALLGLLSWILRDRLDARLVRRSHWAATVVAVATIVWATGESRRALRILITTVHGALTLPQIGGILDVRLMTAIAAIILWFILSRLRASRGLPILVAALGAISAAALSNSYSDFQTLGSSSNAALAKSWSRWISPASTVLVTPTHDAGGFVWFDLARPNYLALNQSAGVVFSRETAAEVRRRSEVLLPLMAPNWKILSNLRASGTRTTTARALTASILIQICTDSALGFVISPENVGFLPRINETNGKWKNWSLYDCDKVRS